MDRVVLFSATTYALFGLASVFTLGRVLARWRRFTGTRYASDDWTSILTFVCVVGVTVANYYQLSNGLGRDIYMLETQTVERFLLVSDAAVPAVPQLTILQWAYISEIFYIAVIFGTKLSLVLLYLRVFQGRSASHTACKILALALLCAFFVFEIVSVSSWINMRVGTAPLIRFRNR